MLPVAPMVSQGQRPDPKPQQPARGWRVLGEKEPFLPGGGFWDGFSPCRRSSPGMPIPRPSLPPPHPPAGAAPVTVTPGVTVANRHKTCPDAAFAKRLLRRPEPGWAPGAAEEPGAALGPPSPPPKSGAKQEEENVTVGFIAPPGSPAAGSAW